MLEYVLSSRFHVERLNFPFLHEAKSCLSGGYKTPLPSAANRATFKETLPVEQCTPEMYRLAGVAEAFFFALIILLSPYCVLELAATAHCRADDGTQFLDS